MKGGWVYIVTNQAFGSLYVGVTSNLRRRIAEHRERTGVGHTAKYGLTRLVYAERHDEILAAIAREKAIKHWGRDWKIDLIMADNPNWDDLFDGYS